MHNNVQPNTWIDGIVNPKGRMPIGVSSFSKLSSKEYDYTFIDKSLFIKEVLDSGDDVILLTRPRRFGKTLNMRMLEAFLAEESTENDPFKHLAITQVGVNYQAERGKRPVIYLSLKDIKASTWKKAFQGMQILLADLVNDVLEGCSTDFLTASKQDILSKISRKQSNDTESTYTFKILTELLTKHHGSKPWILIDEYDTPMQTAYQHGFYKEMRDLMQGLLGQALKDNPHLHRGVITGIVRVAKEDIFSGLNNLGTYGVLDEEFSNYFGFTQGEVNALLEQKGLGEHKETVKHWYNGYQFGGCTVYNPWSIINFVSSKRHEPKLYWINTSTNHLVHQLVTKADVEVKQALHELLTYPIEHTVVQELYQYVPLSEMEDDPRNVWSLLLAAGYLTASHQEKIEQSSAYSVHFRIPNEEVRSVYGDLVHTWLRKRGGISGYGLIATLLAGELAIFAEDFAQFFRASASHFDVGNNQPEKFYHGFIIGMVQHLRNQYSILSQRESGGGRYDLALIPKNKQQPGFVFEFKRAPQKGTLEAVQAQLEAPARAALQQIKDQGYVTQLFEAGVQQVHMIGFAFSGKEVGVAFESSCQNKV